MKLIDLDLSKVSKLQQANKILEEIQEYDEARREYEKEANMITKEHLIEEFCDLIQAEIGEMQVFYNIRTDEIEEYWNTKHLKKMENRPRKRNFFEELRKGKK